MRGTPAFLLTTAFLATALTGCIRAGDGADDEGAGPVPTPSYAHLNAPNADGTSDNDDGTRRFTFTGAVTAGGVRILANYAPPLPFLDEPFEVDGTVGFVEVAIEAADPPGRVDAYAIDADGRVQCATTVDEVPKSCTVPVIPGSPPSEWRLQVRQGFPMATPGMTFAASVTLHPPSHLTIGDPRAGTDPAIRFRVTQTSDDGREPTLGLLSDGTLFVQNMLQTLRSDDDGRSWTDVAPLSTSITTLDPYLFVEPWTDTVYVDQLMSGCSVLAWSQDGGASWLSNPTACGPLVNDHQKIAAGPSPLPLARNAVYYAYTDFTDANTSFVVRSWDGGLTWATTRVSGVSNVYAERELDSAGIVRADREGNVYVGYYLCERDGGVAIAVSHDHGLTFEVVEAALDPLSCDDPDPGLGIDTDGTVYLAYHRRNSVAYVFSRDHGETWSAPVTVSPASLGSFAHVAAVAGDPGRLAILYRATPDSAKGPSAADGWAAWHTYVSFVDGATDPAPTSRTALVNDPSDIAQRGAICVEGVRCADGSRNLLDFIDIAVGPDGRVYVAYTDGCAAECPMPADSRDWVGIVGVLEEGPRLFATAAPWAAQDASGAPEMRLGPAPLRQA